MLILQMYGIIPPGLLCIQQNDYDNSTEIFLYPSENLVKTLPNFSCILSVFSTAQFGGKSRKKPEKTRKKP